MKQYALYAMTLAVTVACGAGVAEAQTTAAANDRGYIEFTGGPTFGHKSGGSVGAEGAWYLMPSLGVYAEAGRMTNVATTGIENDAQIIASFIGGSATPKTKVTYFDAGVTFRMPIGSQRVHPYALFGVGAAQVKNETSFSVNGTDVTGNLLNQYGVQLGTDLSGTYTKAFVAVGVGAHIPIGKRLLGDVSYRYGWIGKETKDNADIAAINTNRLQFGIGVRF